MVVGLIRGRIGNRIARGVGRLPRVRHEFRHCVVREAVPVVSAQTGSVVLAICISDGGQCDREGDQSFASHFSKPFKYVLNNKQ